MSDSPNALLDGVKDRLVEAMVRCSRVKPPPDAEDACRGLLREGLDGLVVAAVADLLAAERELAAQTAEWEHARGTNGIGIAAAIRQGHRRTE